MARPSEPGPPPLRVHFHGVVLGPSGFAAQGRDWLRLLDAEGLQPSLCGARLGELDGGESADDRDLIARCAARPRSDHAITIHHVLPPHFAPDPRALADVLITVFETEGLPAGWAQSLARADAVIVPTWFNVRSFARGGVAPARLHAIAVPVAAQRFTPGLAPWPGLPPRTPGVVRFLSVFDWSLRKGIDVLLPAFAATFAAEQAELVLKVNPRAGCDPAALQAWCARELAAHRRGAAPAVHVVAAVLDDAQVPGLYAGADAFVLCSRGEGWGRPVHEAMLMELPVVASSGHALATLLPGPEFGFPVAGRIAPVTPAAAAETPAFAGQHWFEPDPDHLRAQLRAAFGLCRAPARSTVTAAARKHALALCDPTMISARLRRVLTAAAAAASGCPA